MDRERELSAISEPIKPFLRGIVAVLLLAVLATTGLTWWRTAGLLQQNALAEARSFTDLIITTRSWSADHGGVWVVKGPGVDTNPLLARLGVSADATATDGRVFTLRNPALMTVQISEMLQDADGAVFRLTSLDPVDPNNASDEWERSALGSFADGASERWEFVDAADGGSLRYMRPLATEEECLRCHGAQGYEVGDIRGAVSVTVPMGDINRQAAANAVGIVLIGALTTAALVWFAFALTARLRRRLLATQAALVEAATTDPLTGLSNRRHVLDRLCEELERATRDEGSVGVLMLDIDHFKAVNDTYGHAAGDAVLSEIASRLAREMRPYDQLGRIGGEEFLIVAPGSTLEEAHALAERARATIAAAPVISSPHSIDVTASIGVTVSGAADCSGVDEILARADEAMYEAKDTGRNRVAERRA